jgi:hypothetical protein
MHPVPGEVPGDWAAACVALIPNTSVAGLVGEFGQPTNNFNDAWGVDWNTCNTYCAGDQIPIVRLLSLVMPIILFDRSIPYSDMGPLVASRLDPVLES